MQNWQQTPFSSLWWTANGEQLIFIQVQFRFPKSQERKYRANIYWVNIFLINIFRVKMYWVKIVRVKMNWVKTGWMKIYWVQIVRVKIKDDMWANAHSWMGFQLTGPQWSAKARNVKTWSSLTMEASCSIVDAIWIKLNRIFRLFASSFYCLNNVLW